MAGIPWFEYDEGDLDLAQRAFVDVLAERAGSWRRQTPQPGLGHLADRE